MRRISVFGVGAVVAVLALGAPALAVGQSPHKGAPIVHGRFGKVPFVGRRPVGRAANSLRFGGGIDGIGVTTGAPRVYIVYWGTQWGTSSTNSKGDLTFSNDSAGYAPDQQEFFKGLGTGTELWSGVMTQYCQGVAAGSQSCPASNTQHVAYPTGGALAGVWVDESTSSPAASTGHQFGVEAVNAAAHFGNTTAALNRNAST